MKMDVDELLAGFDRVIESYITEVTNLDRIHRIVYDEEHLDYRPDSIENGYFCIQAIAGNKKFDIGYISESGSGVVLNLPHEIYMFLTSKGEDLIEEVVGDSISDLARICRGFIDKLSREDIGCTIEEKNPTTRI